MFGMLLVVLGHLLMVVKFNTTNKGYIISNSSKQTKRWRGGGEKVLVCRLLQDVIKRNSLDVFPSIRVY